jgi:type I restriction enzyme S subunit
MMSKKSPQLRFEGFTDDWEERKLSSGLREYTDRVIVEDDKEYYQISVRNNFGGITLRGSKMGNKIGRKRQAKINLTKYPQTLIFTRQTVEQGGIGWVDKYCDGAIVTENMPTISLDTSVFSKHFLTNLFQTRIFYKNAILDNIEGGSAQIAIHESKFLSSTLLFPNLDEQEKIGQFFKQLDDTIDLHQRKLDLLKEQKKGYLQKMFPKNGAKVPELRFAGFADDWEQRKLGEISEKVTLKNKDNTFDETLTNSAEFGIISQNDFFDKEISNRSNLNGYYVVENNNFVYNPRISNFAPVGPIKRNKLGRTGVMSPLYYVFKTRNIDNDFLEKYFDTTYWHIFMKLNGDSGARADRFAIKDSVFKEMPIPFPKIEEQIKIGNFFKQLDDTIALHQRKS